LQAFFKGLEQSVFQLIQKLIEAAAMAAIISALTGGKAGSFGKLFSKILGFAGGGIVSGPTLALVGEGAGTTE